MYSQVKLKIKKTMKKKQQQIATIKFVVCVYICKGRDLVFKPKKRNRMKFAFLTNSRNHASLEKL